MTTATILADSYLAAAGGDLTEAAAAFARSGIASRKLARAWLVENGTAYASFRSYWAGSVSASVVASLEAAS